MKIGIILNEFSSPDEVARLGRLAESYGIDTLWSENYPTARDPFLALAPCAAATETIRLAPLAISPFEMHPVKLAIALHSLNELSRGRAGLLIGAGGGVLMALKQEPKRKVRAVGEAIEIVKRAATEEIIFHEGEIYNAIATSTRWDPYPAPIVYAGSTGPKMITMAARVADGTMLSDAPLVLMPEINERLDQALQKTGRDRSSFRVNNFLAWHIKEDKDASYKEARRELYLRGLLQDYWMKPFLSDDDVALANENMHSFRMAFRRRTHVIEDVPDRIVDALIDGLSIWGGLDALGSAIEKLKKFQKLGLDEVALRLHDDQEDAIKLIGEEVMPHFS